MKNDFVFLSEKEWMLLNTKERSNYENSLKVYRDIKNSLDYAKEKGIEQGREEGIEQGREEGIKQTQINNAKKALLEGLSMDLISKITELSIEEIKQIKADLGL